MTKYAADRLLVKRLLGRDQQAFNDFFDLYFDRLHRFALYRLAGDQEAARDATQSTLIRAIRKIDTFRGEAGLYTWLCTLCRHEVSDYLRRETKHAGKVTLIEDSVEVRGALESLDRNLADDPEAQYARTQGARAIEVTLDQLPAHYGDALEWKYIYGFSTREIASRLGLGTEATQSLLARARRAFYDAYGSLSEGLLMPGATESGDTQS